MAQTEPRSFDDPVLKDAVRRVWGADAAPALLRQRIEAMGLGTAEAPAALAVPGRALARRRIGLGAIIRHPWSIYGLAAAAMVVLGFALAARLNEGHVSEWAGVNGGGTRSGQYSSATRVLPASVAKGIIDIHDRCQKNYPDHQQFKDLPRGDFEALRRRLQEQLGFPVLAAPLDGTADGSDGTDDAGAGGWHFRGGAICPVDHHKASHLVFVRNGQYVSVFSLPRASCPGAHGEQECEDLDPEHPLIVIVRPDGIHCIVGSSRDKSLSPEQLRRISERLRRFLQR